MKGKTSDYGCFGEDFTVKILKKNGYKIISRNYHSRFGEIDIIAIKNSIIAFVEVKTRSEGSLYSPREAVDYYKQQKCIKTAQTFLLDGFSEYQPRFDVCEVILEKRQDEKFKVKEHTYIKNAF